MMNERQAWLKLGEMFDGAKLSGDHYETKKAGTIGLCPTINFLRDRLDPGVAETMLAKIGKLPRVPHLGDRLFCWLTNKKGAKKRTAFCRRQAALLAKKKKAK